MNIRNYFSLLAVLFLLVNLSVAYDHDDEDNVATKTIHTAVCSMVEVVKTSMGAVFLVMIVLAAIVYAAGQVMGAETRARANVWATSMFVGAIIGGLIYLIVPLFINELTGEDIITACEELD